MLLRKVLTMSSLTVLLAAGSCTGMGNFCDIAFELRTERDVAEYLLKNDRAFVEDLNLHNRNVAECP